ncbi:MAG: hypothetical protein EOM25_13660, partial [Deltaproteobacteria bacterium]|nr:hypothetical protein [Deltaproteobacteria bacterium]
METTLVREDAVVGENSLSCLEKYLLRKSWTVEDRCDQASGLVLTVSRSPEGRELTYPHPAYEYPDQNRGQILAETLDRLADIEGRPQTEIRLDMRSA